MFKSLGGRGFNSSCWGEHSDNGNWRVGGNLYQNEYYTIFFFSKKVTFTFTFQNNTVLTTFTSLALKGHDVNSIFRN